MSSTGAVSQPTSSAGSARPCLLLVKDGKQQTVALDSTPLSIGRRATNRVVLRNPHVSRDHATIVQEMNDYFLVDNGSKHGTYINGEAPIYDPRIPEPGDGASWTNTEI